jgi:hypothetical protein
MGLRNPFRFHIDPFDNSLFITDVGWETWEEVDHVTGPGQNLGWPYFEGPMTYVSACPDIVPGVPVQGPIFATYRLGVTSASMSGGVYRHPAGCNDCGFPADYEGDYFYSDYYRGFLHRLRFSNNVWTIAPPAPGQPNETDWGTGFEQVSDYLQGPDGALWYVRNSAQYLDNTGEIHRIFHLDGALAVPPPAGRDLELGAPFPSPARGAANLPFSLARRSRVSLSIFDAQGRRVRRLLDDVEREVGPQSQRWDGRFDDGRLAPPGIYQAQLVSGATRQTRRIALIR